MPVFSAKDANRPILIPWDDHAEYEEIMEAVMEYGAELNGEW